jgi:glycine/D-amino acid oxidase-like deaminating enzyme
MTFKSFLCVFCPKASPQRSLHTNTKPFAAAATRICDVAVIGSGFAGLSAAIEASNILPNDSKIIIIEKMPVPGGNSVMNAGQIAAVGSLQQQLGGSDMLKAGVDLNHPNLLRKLAEESNNIVEWTQNTLGIEHRDRVSQLGGHSVPRTLRYVGSLFSETREMQFAPDSLTAFQKHSECFRKRYHSSYAKNSEPRA